jgi:SAM-dependent methyltransferase
VDLEALADGYRHRPPSAESLAHAARAADSVGLQAGDWALDAGGGPGAHAAVWASRGAGAVVLDASAAMVRTAASRPGVVAAVGRTQQMPFADRKLSLVYFHLSIHYGDWRAALTEAHRVLRPGGECWVWTLGAVHHRASFLARWFPSVGEIDAARFPDPAEIADVMADRFGGVTRGTAREIVTRRAGSWIEAVRGGFVSTLQLVPPVELEAGLAAFRREYPDPDTEVEYQMRWEWLSTQRRTLR